MGERRLKHFKTEERNNFVYHMASEHRQKAMQERRGPACERGIQTLALWQKVANAAAVGVSYQPAEETVRVVKAAFVTARLAANPRKTGGLIQVLFDSFSQPALAGTRSAATRIRQMLYRAEPYQIDLQIELQQERHSLVVTGQLLDVSHPEVIGRDVQLTLSNCGASIVNTVTNQFGEFRGELENSGDLELSFLGREGNPVVILLRGVVDPLS